MENRSPSPPRARIGRGPVLFALLLLLFLVWQAVEHDRVREARRNALLSRARDLATAVDIVLRAQTRFATIPRDRLQAALDALAQSNELLALALVSPAGETVAAAGTPLPPGTTALAPGEQQWQRNSLTVVELVQFEAEPEAPGEERTGGLLLVERRPRGPRPRDGDARRGSEPEGVTESPRPESPASPDTPDAGTGTVESASPPAAGTAPRTGPGASRGAGNLDEEARQRFRRWLRANRRWGNPPRYPPWMSKEELEERFAKYGLQRFVLVLSSADVTAQVRQDLWLRSAFGIAAILAAGGIVFSWRNVRRATDLRLRLVRAQEMNTHLREMNTAAAGLAHETRNPLNSVRGLAQLIADDPDRGGPGRQRAETIIAEVDRINSRLGEFIAYSRPKPPNLAPVHLAQLVRDVARALETDREEKHIELLLALPDMRVMADDGQLRQVLFNLMLNAYQAVPAGGTVQIAAAKAADGVALRIADSGSGVPAEAREDIFRPYFTLNQSGSGLGLAVVRQIVLAHHWDIACRSADKGGAEFEIAGIRPAV